jgi:hypothetical protein
LGGGEWIGLADYPLRPMILVAGVDILEENGMCAWQDGNVDAFGLEVVYRRHVGGRQGRNELETDIEP